MERAVPNLPIWPLAEYNIPIITQNIDCLHQRAGSRKVAQIHGYYNEFICENCQGSFPLPQERAVLHLCPVCKTVLKPKVVLYGEQLVDREEAVSIATAAKTMLVIGTSLQVYPCSLSAPNGRGAGGQRLSSSTKGQIPWCQHIWNNWPGEISLTNEGFSSCWANYVYR